MARRSRRNSTDSPRAAERVQFARDQRKTANEFSQEVWSMVRGGAIGGCKFRREHPEPPFTLDFVCLEIRLVIEVDGESHFTDQGQKKDAWRDAELARRGFKVIRIKGYDVLREPGDVRRRIADAVSQRKAEQRLE